MWKVYKRTCPNGKVYIGITKRSLEERMRNGYFNNRNFMLDIIKYGTDNIISEVLEEYDTYDEAVKRELYYIKQYKDICYNKIGNAKSKVHKHTSPQKRMHKPPCTKHHPKISNKCIDDNKPHSAQNHYYKTHIVPITEKPKDRHSCPINIYNLNGEYICTYPDAKTTSEQLNINHGDIISCCKGVKSDGKARYQVKGYVFRYAIDKLNEFPDIPVACKKIEQYTLNGDYIGTFNSMKEAFLQTGVNSVRIGMVCKGVIKSAGDFIWKYAN